MSDTKVGILIDESAVRDAIHMAVAPVVSSGAFNPGEHVGFMPDGRIGIRTESKIGIVDPFLKQPVRENERCWIFLYPQTVTGIKHHWSHPAFSDTGPAEKPSMSESEMFLRVYARRMNSYDENPEAAFGRLLTGLREKDLFAYGSDLHGLFDLDDQDLLRAHAERYLGITINWEDYTFRCSC